MVFRHDQRKALQTLQQICHIFRDLLPPPQRVDQVHHVLRAHLFAGKIAKALHKIDVRSPDLYITCRWDIRQNVVPPLTEQCHALRSQLRSNFCSRAHEERQGIEGLCLCHNDQLPSIEAKRAIARKNGIDGLLDAQSSVSGSGPGNSAMKGLGLLPNISVPVFPSFLNGNDTFPVADEGSPDPDAAVPLFSFSIASTVCEGTLPCNAPDPGVR